MNFLLRVRAVASKEFWALVRQPQLLALLLIGPVLIMVVFALSFDAGSYLPRAVVVVEEGSEGEEIFEQFQRQFTERTRFQGVMRSVDEADEMLRNDETDAVIIMPSEPSERVAESEQAVLEVHYNNINPIFGTTVPNRANGLILDLNRSIVREGIAQELQAIRPTQEQVEELNEQIDQVNETAETLASDDARQTTSDLDSSLATLETTLEILSLADDENEDVQNALEETRNARELLAEVQEAQDEGAESIQEQAGTAQLQASLAELSEESAALPADVPAQVLVNPLRLVVENLAPFEPDAAGFYAPSTLGLLIQHIALSLASLAIVRERLSGAYEYFEVSPLGAGELLIGKFLTYLLLVVAVNMAVAVALVSLLELQVQGSLGMLASVMAMLSATSIAAGFLLSAVSRSQLQAIQVSMLAFIGSGFFSGFLFPLEELDQPATSVSYLFPATYGIRALRDVMLRGEWPATFDLVGLGVFFLVCLVAARLLMGRKKGVS